MHDFTSFLNFITIFSRTLAVIILFDQHRRQTQRMFPIASIAYYHKIVEILENAPELQQSISGICKQTMCAAAGTLIGGCLGGPLGAAAGGVAGVYFGYQTASEYRPLIQVVRELNDHERQRLVRGAQELVGTAAVEDLINYMRNEGGRAALFQLVRTITGDERQQSWNDMPSTSKF